MSESELTRIYGIYRIMKRIAFLLFAFFIPLAIYLLPIFGLENIIQKLDTHLPFWLFSLQLGIGLLLFAELFSDFKKWLAGIVSETKISMLLALLAIATITFFISISWIEGGSRTETDESIYLATAQNLYHNQIGITCIEGTFSELGLICTDGRDVVKARGLSYLYMLGMPIFGKDLYWVYNFHSFLLLLTLPIFFFALKAWTKSDALSIMSVALLSSVPILLFQFRSASIESAYVLFFVLSLLFLKWAYDSNTTRHWLLLALILAFFAQTRSETVFCLFAFIFVAAIRMSNGQGTRARIFSILNSQFSIFLATLSFFSLPVLCTLSLGRNNPLQGGSSYSTYGHLFENIVENFKIMALSKTTTEGLLEYPFFPYFTWLAILGLIMLIILTLSEPRFSGLKDSQDNSKKLSIINYPLSIKYRHIALFLLLLSPQSLILFNAVSADFRITVQQRFILVVLPAMSFLGALFIWKIFSILKNRVNPKILLIGVLTVILINTLSYHESFKQNIMYNASGLSKEKNYMHNWIKKHPSQEKLFFYLSPVIFISHGFSSYSHILMSRLDSIDVQEILKEYNGEVYFVNGFHCKNFYPPKKMIFPIFTNICERLGKYFEFEKVESSGITSIHRIKGLTDIDPKGLLRLIDFREDTKDSVLVLSYILPKKDFFPWKFQRYINNELMLETLYEHSTPSDRYKISLLELDTNVIDFKIVDTITGDTVHKDYLKLKRIKQ